MKAHELAELLMKHPDFEVNVTTVDDTNCTAERPWPNYRTFSVIGIADIGHSDKVIVLDVE